MTHTECGKDVKKTQLPADVQAKAAWSSRLKWEHQREIEKVHVDAYNVCMYTFFYALGPFKGPSFFLSSFQSILCQFCPRIIKFTTLYYFSVFVVGFWKRQ